MKRLRIFGATMVFFAASALGGGQRSFAVSRSPEVAEKTPPAKTRACAEIAAWMNGVLRAAISTGVDSPSVPKEIAQGNLQPGNLDCGAVPSLVPGIPLELMKTFYDRTLHSWEFSCAARTPAIVSLFWFAGLNRLRRILCCRINWRLRRPHLRESSLGEDSILSCVRDKP